jgi:DNA-binding MarR family transcriptional regulator
MGKMIGFLERDGFVTMRPSPTDGRIRIVELTPEGADLFERAAPFWLEAQRQFSIMNGPKNVAVLRARVRRVIPKPIALIVIRVAHFLFHGKRH